jgi:hypothetical protein
MADGFYRADLASGVRQPALRVINNADAPDELEIFYADPSVQVAVIGNSPTTCTPVACDQLTATAGLAPGDLVVMSTPRWLDLPEFTDGAKVAQLKACVLEVASVGPNQLTFSESPPWGDPGNMFCQSPPDPGPPNPGPGYPGADLARGRTVFYKLAARRWRIDPARPAEGVLQLSTLGAFTGGAGDWQDQAYGFTDLQIATRFYDPDDLTTPGDPDHDSDPERDWYSGEAQELWTAPEITLRVPLQISISLVARTERDVEGIASVSTPSLTVAGNEQHNTVGDRAAIPLPSPLPALAGNRIYRYTTFQVDLRNLGVGR